MDELIAQAVAIGRGMWRRRWIGLGVAWLVAAVGAVFLWKLPERYEANARVFVDTKSVLKPLMRDLAVEPDIDQTVGLLAKTLITRPNVEMLMRKVKLETPGMTQPERDVIVDRLQRDIKVSSSGRDNVFNFTYRDPDAVRARVVVESLVSLFVDSDLGAKMRDTEQAREFINVQIKAHEGRLAEAETRLKDFKLKNLGMTDAGGKDYFARISSVTEELGKLTLELRAAEQSRDALRHEVAGETVALVPETATQAIVIASPEIESRLDAQRRQLDELLRRYTDLHPDVVATRRLIARLEEQRQQDIDAKQRAAAARPSAGRAESNTGAQQVKLALATAEGSVAALRVRVNDAQSRLNQLRASATRVPQVEAELAQLNRDYEVVRRNYDALVGRREQASMSEEVDSTRLAHFRVIDPPRTTDKPVFPNRLGLAPLVLLASLAAGIAMSFLMVQLIPTFDNARALRETLQRPILGSISMLKTSSALSRSRMASLAFVMSLGLLIVLYGGWVGWMTMGPKA